MSFIHARTARSSSIKSFESPSFLIRSLFVSKTLCVKNKLNKSVETCLSNGLCQKRAITRSSGSNSHLLLLRPDIERIMPASPSFLNLPSHHSFIILYQSPASYLRLEPSHRLIIFKWRAMNLSLCSLTENSCLHSKFEVKLANRFKGEKTFLSCHFFFQTSQPSLIVIPIRALSISARRL